MSYTDVGSISLWRTDSDNPKAPSLTGSIEINEVRYSVSIWKNDSDNSKAPLLKGKVQVKEGDTAAPKPASDKPDFDDSIPF